MIVQSTPVTLKQRNQANRECLYAWYPEALPDDSENNSRISSAQAARDIYIHKGIDRTLLDDNSSIVQFLGNNDDNDVIQRYKQSTAPSERIYRSPETIDEALKTPWALHYEVERRPATPNPKSHANDLSQRDEAPRRLKSAPLIRTPASNTVLTVPEPQFAMPIIPTTTNNNNLPARVRASSARARLNTTFPSTNETVEEISKKPSLREIHSAALVRPKEEVKLSEEEKEKILAQVYSDKIQKDGSVLVDPFSSGSNLSLASVNTTQSVPVVPMDRKPPRPPQYQHASLPPNIHYIHRPGVISANNSDKRAIVRSTSGTRRSNRRHRRSTHSQGRHEPMIALTPLVPFRQHSIELEGIKLLYDPSLTLEDPSTNLRKYFVDGRLYLIKDQRYNVLENIDPSALENYQQSSGLVTRPKYYQTIPIDKFQIPKPPAELHYNASETYFYNTIPKRVHRYVIDPNFISENLNVNKISLTKRPSTANVLHSSSRETHRPPPSRPVYA